ncbi:DUF4825 domain-containing protein [Metabacillus sp. RGM 3146]|uniref:DUF4825 domain-containing protein n=1 Tax=Metabacillus sp. RGM 3146 TaxID=3401092 RepID=UPI003B9BB6C2
MSGCSLKGNASETIFQYKDSYIGDTSAVAGIIKQLRSNEQFEKLSLETKNKPYGMVVDYKESRSMSEKNMEETALYNAAFIFALIKNANWITFDFEIQKYTITKEKLEKWYGKPLGKISGEKELKSIYNQKGVKGFFEN